MVSDTTEPSGDFSTVGIAVDSRLIADCSCPKYLYFDQSHLQNIPIFRDDFPIQTSNFEARGFSSEPKTSKA